MKILVVEDSPQVAETVMDYLELAGHRVDCAYHGQAALQLLAEQRFDVIIMDVMMPRLDGLRTVERLRSDGIATPVLFLTARDSLDDKLAGFKAGGDDYLVKPFALQELEVRLLALARRSAVRPADPVLRHGALEFRAATQELRLQGRLLALPPKPLRLVAELLAQPERVFSRRELEIAVWGHEQDSSDNLRSVLHTLRRTLGDDASTQVVNVHGLGYKLVSR